MKSGPRIHVGCAGWALASAAKPFFPAEGTHLERYARVFSTVEINSSFYRPHRRDTYRRWADSVPEGFRFTAKLPREITHDLRLRATEKALDRFLGEVTGLGDRLGVLLAQFPASFAFEERVATDFLASFRAAFGGRLAWEARHPSWFVPEALRLLEEHGIATVAADPAVVPAAAAPGGSPEFAYFRWHGSPRLYYSDYPEDALRRLAERLREGRRETYCIFDNTAAGAAIPNALRVRELLSG